jgi:uroporphyrin-III C-methyltransferase
MKHLESITGKLIHAGRPEDQGAAIVCNATTPRQQVLISTLGEIAKEARESDLQPPALVVIGDVVKLHDGLDWLGVHQTGKKLNPDPLG